MPGIFEAFSGNGKKSLFPKIRRILLRFRRKKLGKAAGAGQTDSLFYGGSINRNSLIREKRVKNQGVGQIENDPGAVGMDRNALAVCGYRIFRLDRQCLHFRSLQICDQADRG